MIKNIFIFIVIIFVLAETAARSLGVANDPLREANNITGYIPEASQSGRFIFNDWTINSMHMISSAEFNTRGDEVLLVGDSIVFGGMRLSQQQRVGEQLDTMLGNETVYSIADGGWGFKNGLNFIEQNIEEIQGTETIIFVLNNADFSAPSSWRCMYDNPVERPFLHFWFFIRSVFFPACLDETPAGLVVPDYNYLEKLQLIHDTLVATRIIIFLYQDKYEFMSDTSLKSQLDDGVFIYGEVFELIDYSDMWDANYYIDNIHPSAEGAAALAGILKIILE